MTNKTQYVVEGLISQVVRETRNINWNELSYQQQCRLKLIGKIVKVSNRSKPLAKLLMLKFPFILENTEKLASLVDEDSESSISTKIIKEILCCSKRQAETYKDFFEAEELGNALLNDILCQTVMLQERQQKQEEENTT